MHTNTTRATQNATLPRRNRQNPTLYQHILSDLAVEANQLKTPVSPTTATKTRNKNNTKCPITPMSAMSEKLRRPFFTRDVPAGGIACRRERTRVEGVNLIDRYG